MAGRLGWMRWVLLGMATGVAVPAAAAVQPVLSGVEGTPRGGATVTVQLTLLNDGAVAERADPPQRIEAVLAVGGRRMPVVLTRSGDAPPATIAAGGFVRIPYALRLPDALPTDTAITLLAPSLGASALALAAPYARMPTPTPSGALASAAPDAAPEAVIPARPAFDSPDPDTGNAYAARLSPYDPMYAVIGSGTNTDARIQLSFKYRLFSPPAGGTRGVLPGLEGIHFGYTQRLFWDLGAKSSPFRNVDYMPELFYLVPATPVRPNLWLGGQVGVRHESNGRDGLDSRSINMIYVQPVASFMLGDYKMSVGPRLWAYVGSLDDNPDIKRYRGNTGLFAEIGQDDGFRLTTNARLNPGTGKGSINADLSYPLAALGVERLGLYIFGQGFAGYGENLLDYNRKVTRLRVGFGFAR